MLSGALSVRSRAGSCAARRGPLGRCLLAAPQQFAHLRRRQRLIVVVALRFAGVGNNSLRRARFAASSSAIASATSGLKLYDEILPAVDGFQRRPAQR